jgi:beta-glucosidase
LNNLDPGSVQLGWTHPAQAPVPAITAAAEAARNAEVAIVVARTHENEQRDRASLTLPNEQDQLISAVAAANPRTVVVLTTGGAVAMPWLNSVPAVLQTYFGGQEVGDALARVLAGDVNPSGKLPNTYPVNDNAVPAGVDNPYAAFTDPDVTFGEGPLVGYQAYADQGIQPLFGFGHGLSYTTFGYDKLKVKDLKLRPKGQGVDESATVRVQVQNTGSRSGAEVVQVYVGQLPTAIKTAPRKLAGFTKIDLKPGQRSTVHIEINKQSLSYWDVGTHQWVTPTGNVPVYVGSSSQDVRLQGTINVS